MPRDAGDRWALAATDQSSVTCLPVLQGPSPLLAETANTVRVAHYDRCYNFAVTVYGHEGFRNWTVPQQQVQSCR